MLKTDSLSKLKKNRPLELLSVVRSCVLSGFMAHVGYFKAFHQRPQPFQGCTCFHFFLLAIILAVET
jgi:hypothetical protein